MATSEVECYRLDKTGFEQILQARPQAAQEMSDVLAQRRVGLVLERDDDRRAGLLAMERGEAAEACARPERWAGDEDVERAVVLLHVIDGADLRARNDFGVCREL